MSLQGSPTLDLDVRSRHSERRIGVSAIFIASASPWMLQSLAIPVLAMCSAAAGLVTAYGFWRAGWLATAHRVARVVWLFDGRWFLTDTRDQRWEATLRSDSRRGPCFVWLCWQGQLRTVFQQPVRHTMLLCQGDLPPGELRRLLVRLRINGG